MVKTEITKRVSSNQKAAIGATILGGIGLIVASIAMKGNSERRYEITDRDYAGKLIKDIQKTVMCISNEYLIQKSEKGLDMADFDEKVQSAMNELSSGLIKTYDDFKAYNDAYKELERF